MNKNKPSEKLSSQAVNKLYDEIDKAMLFFNEIKYQTNFMLNKCLNNKEKVNNNENEIFIDCLKRINFQILITEKVIEDISNGIASEQDSTHFYLAPRGFVIDMLNRTFKDIDKSVSNENNIIQNFKHDFLNKIKYKTYLQ